MTTIKQYDSQIALIEPQKDAIVLILAASREVSGERVPITGAQKDAAMDAAKAVLECVGAEVAASSSALLVPAIEPSPERALTLTVDVALCANELNE